MKVPGHYYPCFRPNPDNVQEGNNLKQTKGAEYII